MLLKIKKYFRFSIDGVTSLEAKVGEIVDIPIEYAEGLIAEGFGKEAPRLIIEIPIRKKDAGKQPENKDAGKQPENKSAK